MGFWLVRDGGIPRRCAATLPLFEKRHPHAQLSFLSSWRRGCGRRARSGRYISWLIGVKGVAWRNIPIDSSGLIVSKKRMSSMVVCVVSQTSMVLTFIGGVEIGDGTDGSGDLGQYTWSALITAIVANTLNGLGGKLRSFRLGGTIGCWMPNKYGIVGSLESESIVTSRGSKEAMEVIVIVSLAIVPDSSVELRTAGVLFLIGLHFFRWALHIKNIQFCGWRIQREKWVHRDNFLETRKFERKDELLIEMKLLEEVMIKTKASRHASRGGRCFKVSAVIIEVWKSLNWRYNWSWWMV